MTPPRAVAVSSRGPTLSLLGSPGCVVSVDLGLERPAHLAAHPSRPLVFVALETDPGAVAAVDLTTEPRVVDLWGNLAANPCHVTVAPDGRWLYTCSYLGAAVTALPLGTEGRFDHRRTPRVLASSGSGQHPRQESSHPHSSLVTASRLVVADLGTDELRCYALRDGEPEGQPAIVTLPAGSGPRSLVAAGAGIACSLELRPGIAWLDCASGSVSVTALDLPLPAQPSDIVVVDGLAVVAVRGSDVLALVKDGAARFIGSPRGVRGLAAVPGGVLAAAEQDDVVVEYAVAAPGLRDTGVAWPVTAPAAVIGWPDAWAATGAPGKAG